MEDIFEEIFGEIRDETDTEEEDITSLGNNSWRVAPQLTISEIYEKIGFWITNIEDDLEKNLSLLILEKLGRFPRRGESISFPSATIVVEKMGERSVEILRVVQDIDS